MIVPPACCVPLTATFVPFLMSVHLPPLKEVAELAETCCELISKEIFGHAPDNSLTLPLMFTGVGAGAGAGAGAGEGVGDGDGAGAGAGAGDGAGAAGGAGAASCVTV